MKSFKQEGLLETREGFKHLAIQLKESLDIQWEYLTPKEQRYLTRKKRM